MNYLRYEGLNRISQVLYHQKYYSPTECPEHAKAELVEESHVLHRLHFLRRMYFPLVVYYRGISRCPGSVVVIPHDERVVAYILRLTRQRVMDEYGPYPHAVLLVDIYGINVLVIELLGAPT